MSLAPLTTCCANSGDIIKIRFTASQPKTRVFNNALSASPPYFMWTTRNSCTSDKDISCNIGLGPINLGVKRRDTLRSLTLTPLNISLQRGSSRERKQIPYLPRSLSFHLRTFRLPPNLAKFKNYRTLGVASDRAFRRELNFRSASKGENHSATISQI